jgi:uncharacterized RDD family membrane protein YckC
MAEALPRLDTLQTVELADGVEIRLRIDGPILRIAAYVVDLAIRVIALILIGIALSLAGVAIGEKVAEGLLLISYFLMDWFYPVVFELGKRGATPGKRLLGLRVVQSNGSPITLGQSILRNFIRFIDGMPVFFYAFGLASCLATKRFQRLGDLAADTVVVYDRLAPMPMLPAPPPMAAAPLTMALTPDETRSLVWFRDRAGLWSEARRAEIADQAATLTGTTGQAGVTRLMAIAHWVQEKRKNH